MIKSGKQYLYNASWICQNGWPWGHPHLYIWPTDTLRIWGASVSQPFMSLTPSFKFNHKLPLSCFFWSQVILINGWETKETLPAATNYPMLQLPFLIHKCVKCLRNEKKKNIYCSKINPLVDRGCGCLSEFPSFPYPKVQSVNKKIIWSCFAIIKDKSVDSLCPGLLNKPTDY